MESAAAANELARQLAEFFGGRSTLQLDFISAEALRFAVYSADGEILREGKDRRLPFADRSIDNICNLASLAMLDDTALDRWLKELHRVSSGSVWVALEKQAQRDRTWWESRFIHAGFRKHPLTQVIVPFEALEDLDPTLTMLFEKLPDAAAQRYPLSQLKAERNLHMDMLREPGIRSDAHLARYEIARQQLRPGMIVLDAACGLGYGSAVMAAGNGPTRIIGVDMSEWAVDYARVNFTSTAKTAFEFHAGDAAKLAFLGKLRWMQW